jgi:hypothetical protein
MKVHLSADIPVSRVAIFAEMAWLERRPELGLLCRTARENGNRVTVASVQAALPGLADAGAQNVIRWAETLRLCDGSGGLTKLGSEAAERDEAPIPEQGVYGLWLVEHPVVGRRVLAAERVASSRDQRFDSIEAVAVSVERGKAFRSVVDPKERFIVRELPSNHNQSGAVGVPTNAKCRLRWTLDFIAERDQWQLDGTIEVAQGRGRHPMGAIKHEPESDGLDLWQTIDIIATDLRQLGEWDRKKRLLAVPASSLTAEQARRFRGSFTVAHLELPNKGVYEGATFEDVPLGPRTAADAQQWAMRLFQDDLAEKPGYRSRSGVRTRFADLTEDTPLEDFGVTLPSHDDLLKQTGDDLARYWTLAASVDLAPFPTSQEDLGSLRIGAPAASAPVVAPSEPAHVVRVPYRGGWSMRRLVDRLLTGTTPRKVLLADRYVRGPENLNSLKLLVSALRATAPNVLIDVWTDDAEADFKKVEALTGTTPRSYRDAFGRSPPHARYFLVLPSQGSGFGWQMDNSPIDARGDASATPDKPLRWRDFSANRVSSDELRPELRQWIAGGDR